MTAPTAAVGIDPGGGRSAESWRDAVAGLGLASDWPPRGRLLVVAPHPDDEVLGMGGALARVGRLGTEVAVVTVTDGEAARPHLDASGRQALGRRRRAESRAAHRHLGLALTRHDLGLPDGRVAALEEELAARLEPLVAGVDVVATVVDDDGHPDHDAVGRVVGRVARAAGRRVVRHAVWAWNWDADTASRLRGAARLRLTTAERAAKAAAVEAHRSQVTAVGQPPILPVRFLAHHLGTDEVVWQDGS